MSKLFHPDAFLIGKLFL